MDLPFLYPQSPVYSCSQFDTTFKDTIDCIYPDYTGADCGENDTWTFLHIPKVGGKQNFAVLTFITNWILNIEIQNNKY